MIDGWAHGLVVVAALGCAAMGGVFFTFSSFVMRALARLPVPDGVRAMQSINREAPTPWFMALLMGTGAACVAVAVVALTEWDEPYAAWLLIGAALYVVGGIGLTVAYHVPRNDALDGVDPDSTAAVEHWQRYVAQWTRWNHVRALASLAASATLTSALRLG